MKLDESKVKFTGHEDHPVIESECDICNNTVKPFCFSRCEEHDRCVHCGMKRKLLKEIPWGHRDGFACKTCVDAIKKRDLDESMEAMSKKKFDPTDYFWLDEIKCPHCDLEFEESFRHIDDQETTDVKCDRCKNTFEVEPDYTVKYSSNRKDKR